MEIGLAETQQTLLTNGLRRPVRGGWTRVKTGRDVVIAAAARRGRVSALGTAALVAAGCKMRGHAIKHCPVGIATPARRTARP